MRFLTLAFCIISLSAISAFAQKSQPGLTLFGSGHFGSEVAVQIEAAAPDALAMVAVGLERGEFRINSLLSIGILGAVIDPLGLVGESGRLQKIYEIPANLPPVLSGTQIHFQVVTLGGISPNGDADFFRRSEVRTLTLWGQHLDG